MGLEQSTAIKTGHKSEGPTIQGWGGGGGEGQGGQWGPLTLSNLVQYFQSSARIRAAFPLVSSLLSFVSIATFAHAIRAILQRDNDSLRSLLVVAFVALVCLLLRCLSIRESRTELFDEVLWELIAEKKKWNKWEGSKNYCGVWKMETTENSGKNWGWRILSNVVVEVLVWEFFGISLLFK